MAIITDDKKNRYLTTGGGPRSELYITGVGQELVAFFNAASASLAAAQNPDDVNQQVSGHRRKRYPGDPGALVGSYVRTTSTEKASGGGGAMPGVRFWCERPTGEGEARRSNARQFTYEGTWLSLKNYARANGIGGPFILRNSSGKSIAVVPD